MAWSFFIPLGIALVVTYIFKKSSDEIAYLAAAILLISLIVSLVIAPWQIQLFLLLLVLLTTRRLSQPTQPFVELREDNKVTLSYRGVNYEPTPPAVEMCDAEVTGKYRGQVCKFSNLKNASVEQPTLGIKYRGASVTGQKALTSLDKDTQLGEG